MEGEIPRRVHRRGITFSHSTVFQYSCTSRLASLRAQASKTFSFRGNMPPSTQIRVSTITETPHLQVFLHKTVHGASDERSAYPVWRPVAPQSLCSHRSRCVVRTCPRLTGQVSVGDGAAFVSILTRMMDSDAAMYKCPSPAITTFAVKTPPVNIVPRCSPSAEMMATPPGAAAKTFPRSSTFNPSGAPTRPS